MSEATPRPWRADKWIGTDRYEAYIYEEDADGRLPIGEFDSIEQADRCVLAVNAHDDAIAAMELAVQEFQSLFHAMLMLKDADANPAVKALRAALTKARGET